MPLGKTVIPYHSSELVRKKLNDGAIVVRRETSLGQGHRQTLCCPANTDLVRVFHMVTGSCRTIEKFHKEAFTAQQH